MKYILLHGLGQTSQSWEKTMKAAGSGLEFLCPDLSEWMHGAFPAYSDLYRQFEKYCENFHEPLNLCGLSLGGILALQYAAEHNGRVNSAALIGTQFSMPKNLLKFQNMVFSLLPRRSFCQMGLEKSEIISLSKSMMHLDFSSDLGKINCRTLIICGEKDRANKTASMELKKRIAGAHLSFVAGSGHEVNIDAPAELGRILHAFWTLQ